ncbi:MAG: hypothetical protein VKP62_10325 [Candidatus Sericytochromatia bacterium]|nr:hypothetical protein [Candidatus Sericytochromatia bacterium]
MRMRNWMAASLSLSLGLGVLAGCGSQPAPTTPPQQEAVAAPVAAPVQAPEAAPQTRVDGPIRAQEGGGSGGSSPALPTGGGSTTAAPPVTQGPSAPAAASGAGAPPPVAQAGTPGAVALISDDVVGGIGGGLVIGATTGNFGEEGDNGLITFQSDRATGGGAGFDIFVFDAAAATVLALPGVNTEANESNPRLSSNGDWLVYQSDEAGNNDIFLFSLRSQLINTLPTLNTDANEEQPDVSNSGDVLVYVSDRQGGPEIRVFDMQDGNNYRVPIANRGLAEPSWPTISGNAEVIAYGATDGWTSDVYVYSLETASQLTPPFLNTENGEYNPDLNDRGDLITFVSDRRGSEDIYAVDMRSGFTDNMVLANSPAMEQEPRWLAGGDNAIVFHTNRTGEFRIMAYNLDSAILNTLPVANELGSNTQLRDTYPHLHTKHHHDGGKKDDEPVKDDVK